MTITATGRFLPTDGLSLPFSRIKAQPWRALRLVACDVAVIAAFMALAYAGGGLEAWPRMTVMALAYLLYIGWFLTSLTAWMRYFADRERPGPIPHRFAMTELKLGALYAMAAAGAVFAGLLVAMPGMALNAAGATPQSIVWFLGAMVVGLWLFARFAPIPARVVLSRQLTPFSFWSETYPMRGRLRWSLACIGVIYCAGGVFTSVLAAGGGINHDIAVGNVDLNVRSLIAETLRQGLPVAAVIASGVALAAGTACRLMLRGVAVQAALVIEAGGETRTAQEPAPVSPPSSSASPDAPGPAPAGA